MSLKPVMNHPWDVTRARAVEIQNDLRARVIVAPLETELEIIGGIDVSVRNGHARAAVVLLSWPNLSPIQAVTARRPATFPYVPGLLAFREGPVVLDTLEKLTESPDVLIFDAHGLAHPRRMGLATHLGVLLDRPTAGCAKSGLCGDYSAPATQKGSWTLLRHRDEVIGAVVRTREGVKPVFVSVGHRVDLESAVSVVLECTTQYRLPETTRRAHRVAAGQPPDRLEPAEPSARCRIQNRETSSKIRAETRSRGQPVCFEKRGTPSR